MTDWRDEFIEEGLTFSDVLLRPQKSDLRSRLDPITRSLLTKKIELAIPIVSANMDTVTESTMAIAMARHGGIGIIHRNCSIEKQVEEVKKVKLAEEGLIRKPYTLLADDLVDLAFKFFEEKQIDSVLIVDSNGCLSGLITKYELANARRFENVGKYMRPRRELIVAQKDLPLTEKEARKTAEKVFKEKPTLGKLPFVDKGNKLIGLLTKKDLYRFVSFPDSTKDESGRLKVGAAVGIDNNAIERAKELLGAGADILVIDVAHGHAHDSMKAVKLMRKKFPDYGLIAGNIATLEAVRDYARIGIDALKVGIGPGATCSTRIVSGAGVPQVSALLECAREANKFKIPIISDGGIRYPRDVSIAIACGASAVMIGTLLAGTDESPGPVIRDQGKSYKWVRGMSSFDVNLEIRGDKYLDADIKTTIQAEGVPGRVPYTGPMVKVLGDLVSGLRSGMTYVGAKTIAELQRPFTRKFIRMSRAAWEESKPHDIEII